MQELKNYTDWNPWDFETITDKLGPWIHVFPSVISKNIFVFMDVLITSM